MVPPAGQSLTIKGDQFIELGMLLQDISAGGCDQPGNLRLGPGLAQQVEHGQGVDDIANGTGLDDEQALRRGG